MSTEFQEFTKKDDTDGDWLNKVINAGLLRINGIPVSKVASEGMDSSQDAAHILLRNMDTLERIVHWHEPPICVPERISFTKHTLPESLISMANDTSTSGYSNAQSQPVIYCINKPSTVPVHPAGPYYANSLLLMVEAQEGLAPRSLIPCHRIDRCTSGVLLCTSNNNVARVVQGAMTSTDSSTIKKMYLARVRGRFPSSPSDNIDSSRLNEHGDIASYTWHGNTLEVSAPIAVHLSGSEGSMCEEDKFAMMHRVVSSDGKHAVSRFKLISYDSNTNQSLVSCAPISGRGHQLRVHLQLIGHPIHDDVEYGGKLNPEAAKEQEAQSIKSILEVSKSSPCLHDESVYEKEAETAISLCKCCCDGECGVKASFQSAQLLGCGHAIDLHAYKYLISFKHKVAVEFTTTMPNWASDFKGTSLNEIHWLQ
jgi:23S rRNA-/tRNA-specific pseudouridylate synthase